MPGDGRGGLLAPGWCHWWLPVAWGWIGWMIEEMLGWKGTSPDSGNKWKEWEATELGAECRRVPCGERVAV